ncbi:AAA domain-containing protein [Nocardia blacklockiae]|uniref:AAA domain-containing protein n=1 Tax=Nocardia blacklockiae TaxID=480036 RepID=UPI00189533CF|nr:AAA domain-containing protein [Nocardia blacklockiae]MBF6171540.1 AAA family ATPase [Nocardia blacklockiae]
MVGRFTHADDVLARKAEEWSNELIQLDGRNGLLNFKITKTSALDLGESPKSEVDQLLSGKTTRLAQLFGDSQRYSDACTRARNLVRRIRGFSEEQGVDVGRLVFGRVTTSASKSGARQQLPLRAPLLLFQVTIRARTAAESDFLIEVDPEPEVNPVLAHCLNREYGVSLDKEELNGLVTSGADPADPERLANSIFLRIEHAAVEQGVSLGLERMIAIGVCNYMKLPMVEDLMSAAHLLRRHDLIALLAGASPADTDPRAEATFQPPSPDMIPPRHEFLVLDADSSQNSAIATALADRHAVIDGPPGTGKSQTIANIIAAGAAQGKKILFVAEKRAAIEAVTDRLAEIGLGDLVLDMHQSALSSRAVATQLADSLDQLARTPAVDGDDMDRELADTRRRLNDYVSALHDRREPWQLSAYQVRESLIASAGGIETPWRLRSLEQFTPEGRLLAEDDLRGFVANGGLRLVRHESPWWQADVATVHAAHQVLLLLDNVAANTLPDSRSQMCALIEQVGLPEPTDFEGWDRTFTLLSGMAGTAGKLGPGIFRGPLHEYRVATASWKRRRKLQPKLGWRRRSRLLKELRANPVGMTQKQLLHNEIIAALEEMQEWSRLSGNPNGPGVIGDFRMVSERYARLKDQLAAIATSAGVSFEQQPLQRVDHALNALATDRRMVPYLPDLNERMGRLRRAGLEPLVNEIATRDLDAEQSVTLFRYALMSALEEQFMLTSQPLRDFQPELHNAVATRFREADRRHQGLAVRRVLRTVARAAAQACTDYPDESTLVRSEGKKKRGHRPVRRLVAEAPHVGLAARPCWAMSPLMVSRALPAEQLFDLVIFDEASQVQPHDAITSIMRGKRLVVAGDDKQLPPTSFFDRLEADDDNDTDDDSSITLRDYESILTALQPMIPNRRRLQWHYRSQDERLIQFSNEEVYDGDLVSFPGARVDAPLRLEIVDGRVQPGERGSAAAEVARVVELVIEHAESRPHESLGVITLGTEHQKKIDMAFRQARADRPDLDDFFADDRGPTKRFFIKNIETVQGDERDAIVLSVGVAKDATGRVRRNGFGVLNREGTERRINVAVTRAKRRMTVVSSFPPGALEPSEKMTGTELLRRYLETAARGATAAAGRQEGVELNAFERSIFDGLNSRGIKAYSQWGVSDYRIDFALAHPEEPGRMVLAVEADGDSYHRTHSARDRDRLRQQHLERLGWRFHRVWASAWFTDPEKELERIYEAWIDAVAVADAEPTIEVPTPDPPTTLSDNEIRPALPRPGVLAGLRIDQYTPSQLIAMFRWRMSDGMLLDPEERTRQVRADLGFKRRGRKIDEALRKAHDEARRLQDQEEL